ncbi:MAG: efflux RND transporter periplasmic adaptor subunit [Planctomycetota bacterium]
MKSIAPFLGSACLVGLGVFIGVAFHTWRAPAPPSRPAAGMPSTIGATSMKSSADGSADGVAGSASTAVEIASAIQEVVYERVAASGAVAPEREVQILARVEGQVETLAIEEGQTIAADATLCEIERASLALAERAAAIERDHTAATFQRQLELAGFKAASDQQIDDARYAKERAAAAHDEAELRLAYSQPRAPFAGTVVKRFIEIGQQVRPGDALFTLADFEPLLLRVYLPDHAVAQVAVGQSVLLYRDRDSDSVGTGRVERVSPVVDRTSLTVEVTLTFPGVAPGLRPGSFCYAEIVTRTLESAILVPRAALRRDADETAVLRVREDNHVQRVLVKVGYEDELYAQVLSDIAPGDQVVVEGGRDLKDGDKVSIHRRHERPTAPRAVRRAN